MGINLFNHQSGVKLPKWKANLAWFVDYKIPVLFMKLLIALMVTFQILFKIGVIICASYIVYLLFR